MIKTIYGPRRSNGYLAQSYARGNHSFSGREGYGDRRQFGEDNDSVYVWIRRFESEAERERLYDEVYGSDYWKEDVSPRLSSMLNREAMVVTRQFPPKCPFYNRIYQKISRLKLSREPSAKVCYEA